MAGGLPAAEIPISTSELGKKPEPKLGRDELEGLYQKMRGLFQARAQTPRVYSTDTLTQESGGVKLKFESVDSISSLATDSKTTPKKGSPDEIIAELKAEEGGITKASVIIEQWETAETKGRVLPEEIGPDAVHKREGIVVTGGKREGGVVVGGTITGEYTYYDRFGDGEVTIIGTVTTLDSNGKLVEVGQDGKPHTVKGRIVTANVGEGVTQGVRSLRKLRDEGDKTATETYEALRDGNGVLVGFTSSDKQGAPITLDDPPITLALYDALIDTATENFWTRDHSEVPFAIAQKKFPDAVHAYRARAEKDINPNGDAKYTLHYKKEEPKPPAKPIAEATPIEISERAKKAQEAAKKTVNAIALAFEAAGLDEKQIKGNANFFALNYWNILLKNAITTNSGNVDLFSARVVNAVNSCISSPALQVGANARQGIQTDITDVQTFYAQEGNDPLIESTRGLIQSLCGSSEQGARQAQTFIDQLNNGELRVGNLVLSLDGLSRSNDILAQSGDAVERRERLFGQMVRSGSTPQEVNFVRYLSDNHQVSTVDTFFTNTFEIDTKMMKDPIKFIAQRAQTIAHEAGVDNQVGIVAALLKITPADIATLIKDRGPSDGQLLGLLMAIGMLPQVFAVFGEGAPPEQPQEQR